MSLAVSLNPFMAADVRNRGNQFVQSRIQSEVHRVDELLPLARAAAAGDSTAAASLVVHVAPLMLKIVRSVFKPGHPDIEDVTHDAVIELLSSLPAFRAESTVLYYAGRIALFTALASRKKEQNRVSLLDEEATSDALAAPVSTSPLAQAIANRKREILLRVLDDLPDATAEALALHFIVGYTVEEIAKASNVSVNTVWSRLRLGKEALLRRLERDRRFGDIERGGP